MRPPLLTGRPCPPDAAAACCLATGGGPTQLTESVWPRPVSVVAGSQRHERAGWNGPAPLPPLLAAGSNALAPNGRGKGRDTPRHRAALTQPRADWRRRVGGHRSFAAMARGCRVPQGQRDGFALDSPLEGTGFEPSVPLLRKALLGVTNRDFGTISGAT
jgi:hypothetical protein